MEDKNHIWDIYGDINNSNNTINMVKFNDYPKREYNRGWVAVGSARQLTELKI